MTETEKWFQDNMKYFKVSEFPVHPELLDKKILLAIDKLRDISQVPIAINCAYAKDGHAPKSYHYLGRAIDFHFKKGVLAPIQQYNFIKQVPEITGIGWYPHWDSPGWHMDNRQNPLCWVWLNNAYNYDFAVFKKAVGIV